MDRTFLKKLRCPYCLKPLILEDVILEQQEELIHAVVRCSCSEYPITNGIINFGGKYPKFFIKEIVSLLKRKQIEKATLFQVETEFFDNTLKGKSLRHLIKYNYSFFINLFKTLKVIYNNKILKNPLFNKILLDINNDFSFYLKYRFILPSFFSALPLIGFIANIKHDNIIDLGCGCGHYSYIIKRIYPECNIICIDQYYCLLFLAKHYFNYHANYICSNLSYPLPLDDYYDIIFCSDFLYTSPKRNQIINNFLPHLDKNGFIIAPRLDTEWEGEYIYTLNKWLNLFKGYQCRFYSEQKLRKLFKYNDIINLNKAQISSELEAKSISLIATNNNDFHSNVSHLSTILLNKFNFILNPIYKKCEELIKYNLYIKDEHTILNKLSSANSREWLAIENRHLPNSLYIPKIYLNNNEIQKKSPDIINYIKKGIAVIKLYEY